MKNATKAALLSMSVGLVIWGCALPETGRGPEAQTPAPKDAAPAAPAAARVQTPAAAAPSAAAPASPIAPLAPSQVMKGTAGRVMIPLPVTQAGTPPEKTPQGAPSVPNPGDSDNVRMQKLLGVTKLRPGVNGTGNAAYDEAAADPFTTVPDPLSLNDGTKVTDAKMWVEKRRPEIVEDFDREVYGRVPKEMPKVTWTVSNTNNNGTTITKTLVGHVDNAIDPAINVNIQVTLVTPANATGPVPVMMQFGGGGGGGFGGGGAPGGGRGGAPGGAPGRGGPGGGAPRNGGAGGPPAGAGAMTPFELPLTAQMEDPFETFFTAAGGGAPGGGAGRGLGGGAGAGRGAGGAPGGRGAAGGAGGGGAWTAQLLAKGWGYATISTSSIQADSAAGVTAGIIGLCNKGQPRKVDDWGVLRAWAWGASRALDYFETDKAVDAKKVGLEGHSRWGKATIIAMAYDERFAICYCSSSGEGGAKLHRRYWGEQVENVAGAGESYWMAGNFVKYAGPLNAGDLPVDSHELIAMCAPRPVLVTAGTQPAGDGWVDAKGTFLAALEAGPVYTLLGKKDMGSAGADGKHVSAKEMPPVETTLTDGDLAFRQHNGGHTDTLNWPAFIEFAGRQFKMMDAKAK